MNYAVTINEEGIITGQHCSALPITDETFANSPTYAGQTVRPTPAMWLGIEGLHVEACDPETLEPKPLIWRIEHGYTACPEGFELIDGELIKVDAPVTERPETIKGMLGRIEADAEAEQRASRVMFRALAQTDMISQEDALDNQGMFPVWEEMTGKEVPSGIYLRYEDGLYRVQQKHTVQAQYAPGVATAALYARVQPDTGVEPWVGGQSYAKDVEVTHKGGVWLSGVDNNTWEPGSAGVFDNIWKRVGDA